MSNVFNRVSSKTFGDLAVGAFFRLETGGGKGSFFLKTGAADALWIWTSAQTALHTNGPVKAGSRASFSDESPVTSASFSPADGD